MFGRAAELNRLAAAFERAKSGNGTVVAVTGEPGSGKSRLVQEGARVAESMGFRVYSGAFSRESPKPYGALSEAMGREIAAAEEHVGFAQILIIDGSGLLVAKAVPQGADDVDSDIFAGMLTAVQNFVKDSFGGGEGSLGRLEYGDMKIVMEPMGSAFFVAFFKGPEHPEMMSHVRSGARGLAEKWGTLLESWGGRTEAVTPVQREVERLATARFLVRKDISGVKLDEERVIIADSMLSWLASASRERPALLVLEDAHWADEGSLHALEYLVNNAPTVGAAVVVTMRRGENVQADARVSALADSKLIDVVDLAGIGEAAVSELLAKEFSPNDFPPDFASRLSGECRGNPFFLTEVLQQMRSDGTIVHADGRHSLTSSTTPLPKSVDELIQRRLDTLDPDAIALAEYASCAGRTFEASAVLSMRALKDAPLALEKLRSSGVLSVTESGAGEFSHAFYCDAIYSNIVPRWKNVYHKGLGEHYERAYFGRLGDAAYELSRHFSSTSEKAKAVKYGIMAGEKAESAYAVEQAIRYYGDVASALRGMQGNPEAESTTRDMLERMGNLRTIVGEYDNAVTDYQTALSTEQDDVRKASLKWRSATARSRQGRHSEAKGICEEGLAILGDRRGRERARLLSLRGWMEFIGGDNGKAMATLGEALAEAREAAEAAEEAACHHRMGTVLGAECKFEMALDELGKALDVRKAQGNLREVAATEGNIGITLRDMGDLDGATEHHERSLELFKKLGDRAGTANALGNLAIVRKDRDDLSGALALQEEAFRIRKRIGDRRGMAISHNNLGNLLKEMGEFEKALAHHAESLAIRESVGDRGGVATSHYNIADALRAMGNNGKALEHLEVAFAICAEIGYGHLQVYVLKDFADTLVRLGRIDEAVAKVGEGVRLARGLNLAKEADELERLLAVAGVRMGSAAASTCPQKAFDIK
jgi:tetratricopeptide (TPR) repeat protein